MCFFVHVFWAFEENLSVHEIKKMVDVWKGLHFKIFFNKHGIVSTPQDIGQTNCANQTIVAMGKHMWKVGGKR